MKSKKIKIILAAFLSFVICFTAWLFWANTALMVNEISIKNDKIPTEFNDYKIMQISDLHNAEFGDNNEKLLDLMKDQEPDIIVITGDLIDSRRTDINISLNFCEKALEIAPIYYVNGNHEARISAYSEFENSLISLGVNVLNDELIQLKKGNESINIIGISDPDFEPYDYLFDDTSYKVDEKLKKFDYDESDFTILLSHRPELFEIYTKNKIDLTFSGHAHGGQIRLPFIGGLVAPNQGLLPEFDEGLYTEKGYNMIVSRGLGNSIIPLRVNNRPEIVIANLVSE